MRDVAFEEAQRCIVMGLIGNSEAGNIPPGHKLDLSGLRDLVVVDRQYLMTHTAEVLLACARVQATLGLPEEEVRRLLGY